MAPFLTLTSSKSINQPEEKFPTNQIMPSISAVNGGKKLIFGIGKTLPSGCLYSPRCENTCSICKDERPKMREIRNGMVRCNNAT